METRFYLAGKGSWSDVTVQISKSPENPKKGGIVKMGKLAMTIKDVVDGKVQGKPVTKVYLENLGEQETRLVNLVEMLDNPIIIGIEEPVNEATVKMKGNLWDPRMQQSNRAPQDSWGVQFRPCTIQMGQYIASSLGSMGTGWGAQVADFGDAVSVTITYSHPKTGRCASQCFVVLWQPDRDPKNPYKVYANIARYRSCAGLDQCIGFIRSKMGSVSGGTSSAI